MAVARHQFHGDVAQVFDGIGQFHQQQAAALEQALVMLPQPENVDDALLLIPVAADALEHPGAVVQGMGGNADLGLAEGDIIPPEKGQRLPALRIVCACSHDIPSDFAAELRNGANRRAL